VGLQCVVCVCGYTVEEQMYRNKVVEQCDGASTGARKWTIYHRRLSSSSNPALVRHIDNVAMCARISFALADASETLATPEYVVESCE
jgi:hypothetical protein